MRRSVAATMSPCEYNIIITRLKRIKTVVPHKNDTDYELWHTRVIEQYLYIYMISCILFNSISYERNCCCCCCGARRRWPDVDKNQLWKYTHNNNNNNNIYYYNRFHIIKLFSPFEFLIYIMTVSPSRAFSPFHGVTIPRSTWWRRYIIIL